MARIETGPVCFGDDWKCVCIRGDDALYYSHTLSILLRALKENKHEFINAFMLNDINDLKELFSSCYQQNDGDFQQLKSFDECKK